LSAACAFGGGALILARVVDKAYIRALARSLMHRGAELDLNDSFDLTTRTVLAHSGLSAVLGSRPAPAPAASTPPASQEPDPVLAQLACLRSQDTGVARAALQNADPTNPLIAAQLVQLLASPDLCAEVVVRLQPVAERFFGLLCDHLRDPGRDFQVRRRIPGLLVGIRQQRSVDGLTAGLGDERFEVRCQCSRALLRLKRAMPGLRFDHGSILSAVDRELSVGKILREGQSFGELDSPLPDREWLDEFLKKRAHTGLEHVFTLLSLEYPEEALSVAFRALDVEDRHLHGTALEYLETVLPDKTRQLLWQVIGEQPVHEKAREAGEVLDDLMRTSATVVLRLRNPEDPLARS
jgi:hypothetical protein